MVEGVHFYLETRNGKTVERFQVGRFGVPIYLVRCYKLIGCFLFGAAVEQTTTNILKFSIGEQSQFVQK